ncbi:MAG: sulfatase [Acidobacteriota bacterium]
MMIFREIHTQMLAFLRRPNSEPQHATTPSPNEQSSLIFPVAVSFGLVSAFAQLVILAVEKFVLHGYVHQGPDVIWMAPLSNVVIFLTPAVLLWLTARRWTRVASPPVVIFIFALLGYLSVLIMADRIDRLAVLALAAGLAVQTARFLTANPELLFRFLRLSVGGISFLKRNKTPSESARDATVALAGPGAGLTRREFLLSTGGTIGALALGVSGWKTLEEQIALSQMPLSWAKSPNVLLITLDTVRAASASLYGYSRSTTPQLARFAKSGALFQKAYGTASWTLPSHGSIFTGYYPHEQVGDWLIPFDSPYPTLAQVLRQRGYDTAGFVANTIYCSKESGLGRGFAHFEDYKISPSQVMKSSSLGFYLNDSSHLRRQIGYYEYLGRKTAAELNDDFLRWLSSRGERPFFAFLNYWDAHEPYLPPVPFDSQFGPTSRDMFSIDSGVHTAELSRRDLEAEANAYDSTIAYLDSQLGRLLDELQARGLLENTCVIITSDHGEEFGEHGLFRHGHSLYIASLHVPLLILFPPRVPANVTVPHPVSLRDLPATIFDLISGEKKPFPGNSMARFWDARHVQTGFGEELILAEISAEDGKPNWVPTSRGKIKSLVAERYQYILNGDGREELYDLVEDPFELNNFAQSEPGKRLVSDFRVSLEDLLAKG